MRHYRLLYRVGETPIEVVSQMICYLRSALAADEVATFHAVVIPDPENDFIKFRSTMDLTVVWSKFVFTLGMRMCFLAEPPVTYYSEEHNRDAGYYNATEYLRKVVPVYRTGLTGPAHFFREILRSIYGISEEDQYFLDLHTLEVGNVPVATTLLELVREQEAYTEALKQREKTSKAAAAAQRPNVEQAQGAAEKAKNRFGIE